MSQTDDHPSFGHVEVAETYLAPIELRAPEDAVVLANGGLCDAVRARLHPEFDRSWAERALARLVAAAHVDPATPSSAAVTAARDQVLRALGQTGDLGPPSPAAALEWLRAGRWHGRMSCLWAPKTRPKRSS